MKTIFTLLLSMILLNASATVHPKNLVFEGGGIRGIAYGGVLLELDSLGLLDSLERVGGTSVGAIQSALLAVGYSPQEVIDEISTLKFQKFSDGRGIFIGGTYRTLNRFGWYRGDRFQQWMARRVEAKLGGDLTLAELHALAQASKQHYDLYTVATNLTRQRVEVISHETYPDLTISEAVRISMSIPLYFEAMFMDSTGHLVDQPKAGQPLDVLVDGGIVANYPIHLFDEQRYLPYGTRGDTTPIVNPYTLGIRLEREDQLAYDQQGQGLAPYSIHSVNDYVGALYNMVIESLNRHDLTSADWDRTIMVGTAGIGPKIKRLKSEEVNLLLSSGRSGARAYLALNN